ncbi:hypothetical protein HDU81_011187 [Chytriomyces hyalinus]|nr:hypothetical protein HDU81_011187 [Chytriomyces hyalinus]
MIPRINIIFLGFPASSNSDNYSREVSDSTCSLVSTSEPNAPRWKSAGSSRRVILELKPATSNASNSRPASNTIYDVVSRAARRNLASDEAISKCFAHVRKGIVTHKPSWGLTIYSGAPDFSLLNMSSDCDMLRDGETLLVVWSPLDQFLHSQDPIDNDPFSDYPQDGINALAVQSATDDKTEVHRTVQLQGCKKPSTDLKNRPPWVHPTSKPNANEKPVDPRNVRRGSIEKKTPHPPTPTKKIPPQLQSQKSSTVNITSNATDTSRHSISSVSSSSNARDSVRPMTPIPHGKNWDHPMGQLANNFSTSYLNFDAEPSPVGNVVPGGRSAEPTPALTVPTGPAANPQTSLPVTFNEPSQPPPWWPPGTPTLTATNPPSSTTPDKNTAKAQTYPAPPIPQELNTDLLMQALMKLFTEASQEGKQPDVQKITSIFLSGPLGSQIQHAALESLLGGQKSHLIESFLASHKPELETVIGSISLPPQLGVSKKRDQNPVEVKNAVAKLVVNAVTSPLGQQLEHTALQAVLGNERTTQVEQLMKEHQAEIMAAAGMISHVTGVKLVHSNPAAGFAQDMMAQAGQFANARQIEQPSPHIDKTPESHTTNNAVGSAFQNAQKWLHSSDGKIPNLPEKNRAAVLSNENTAPVAQQLSSFMASLHHGQDANIAKSKDEQHVTSKHLLTNPIESKLSTGGVSEVIYKEPSEPPPWWPKGKPALTFMPHEETYAEQLRTPNGDETRQSISETSDVNEPLDGDDESLAYERSAPNRNVQPFTQRQVPQPLSHKPSHSLATPHENTVKPEPSFMSKMQSMFTEDSHNERKNHAESQPQSHSAIALLSKVQHYLEPDPEPAQSRSVKNTSNESHSVGDGHKPANLIQPHTLLSKMQSLLSNDSEAKAPEPVASKHQHPSQVVAEPMKHAGASFLSRAQQLLDPEDDEEAVVPAKPAKPATQHTSKLSPEPQHDPLKKPYLKKKASSDTKTAKAPGDGALRAKMLSLLDADSDDEQTPSDKTTEKIPEKNPAANKQPGKVKSAETKSQSTASPKPQHHDFTKPRPRKAPPKTSAEGTEAKPHSDGALRAKLLSMLDAESDQETSSEKPAPKKVSPVEKKRSDSNKSTSSIKPKSRESSAGSEKKPHSGSTPNSLRSKAQAALHDEFEKKPQPKKPSKSDNEPAHSSNPKPKAQPNLKNRDSSAGSLDTTAPKSSFFSKMQAALDSDSDSSSPPSREEKSSDPSPERPKSKRPNSADKRGHDEKGSRAKTQAALAKDQPNQKNTALKKPQTSRTQLNDRNQSNSKLNSTSSAKKPIPHSSSNPSLHKDESQQSSKPDPKSNLQSKMLDRLFGDDSDQEAKHDSESGQETKHTADGRKGSLVEKQSDQGPSKSQHKPRPDSNSGNLRPLHQYDLTTNPTVKPSSDSSPITKLRSKMMESLFDDDSDSPSGNDVVNKRNGTFLRGAMDAGKDTRNQHPQSERPLLNSRTTNRGQQDEDLETSVSGKSSPQALPEKSLLGSLKSKADAAGGDFKKALGRNADVRPEDGAKKEKTGSRGIEATHDINAHFDSKQDGIKPGKYVRSGQSSIVSDRDSLGASQVLGSSKQRHRISATKLANSKSFDKLVIEGTAVLEKLADSSDSNGSTPPQRRKNKSVPPKMDLASTSFGKLEDMASDSDSGARRGRTGRKTVRHHESVESLHSLHSERGSKAGSDYHESVDSMSDNDSKQLHKTSRAISSPPHSRSKQVKKPKPTTRRRTNSSDLDGSDDSEPRYKTHSATKKKDENAHVPRNGSASRGKPSGSDSREIQTDPKHKDISQRASVWSQMDERGRVGFNTMADYELRTKKLVLEAEVKKCQAEACVKQSTIEWEIQKLQTESKKADRDVELRKVELEMLRKNGFHLRQYNSRVNLFRLGLSNMTLVAAGTLLHGACIKPNSPASIKWGFAALALPFAIGCVIETGLGVVSYLKAVFRGHDVLDEFETKPPPVKVEPKVEEKEWEPLHFEDSTDTLADI